MDRTPIEKTPIEKKRATIIVIPAYEPGEQLLELARGVTDAGYRIIVVDDGSSPACDPIFEALHEARRVRVIHHDCNKGKGAALKTAFTYIREYDLGADHIVTMDADGQHLISDMERVAQASWEAPDQLILGSRELGRDIPKKSYLGNTITRTVFKTISGTKIHDTQTGLRAFGGELLDRFRLLPGDRYEYEMNMLMYCSRQGIGIWELPIQTVYLDESNSCSHFHPVKDAVRIYGNIFRFAGASFISFLADYGLFAAFWAVLSQVSGGLLISNVAARVISALLNYTLNAKAVFNDSQPVKKTLPKYISLAAFILAMNSLILTFFTQVLGIWPLAAKIMTELILFVVSYLVQSKLIFRINHRKERRQAGLLQKERS